MNHREYLEEHHHITETTLGLAKLHLIEDRPEAALERLHVGSANLQVIRNTYAEHLNIKFPTDDAKAPNVSASPSDEWI